MITQGKIDEIVKAAGEDVDNLKQYEKSSPAEHGVSQEMKTGKAPKQRKLGKVYIGTKVVRAEPMSNEEWLRSQNKWQDAQETAGDGYKVQYEDGYLSWSPKEVFERCYRELTPQEKSMTFDF
jgi:hypothetical protein